MILRQRSYVDYRGKADPEEDDEEYEEEEADDDERKGIIREAPRSASTDQQILDILYEWGGRSRSEPRSTKKLRQDSNKAVVGHLIPILRMLYISSMASVSTQLQQIRKALFEKKRRNRFFKESWAFITQVFDRPESIAEFFNSDAGDRVCEILGLPPRQRSSEHSSADLRGLLAIQQRQCPEGLGNYYRSFMNRVSLALTPHKVVFFGPQGNGKTTIVSTLLLLTQEWSAGRATLPESLAASALSLRALAFAEGEAGEGYSCGSSELGVVESVCGQVCGVRFPGGEVELIYGSHRVGENVRVMRYNYDLREECAGVRGPLCAFFDHVRDGFPISRCSPRGIGLLNNAAPIHCTTNKGLTHVYGEYRGVMYRTRTLWEVENVVSRVLDLRTQDMGLEALEAHEDCLSLIAFLRPHDPVMGPDELFARRGEPLDAWAHPDRVRVARSMYGHVRVMLLPHASSRQEHLEGLVMLQEHALVLEQHPLVVSVVLSSPSFLVRGSVAYDLAGADNLLHTKATQRAILGSIMKEEDDDDVEESGKGGDVICLILNKPWETADVKEELKADMVRALCTPRRRLLVVISLDERFSRFSYCGASGEIGKLRAQVLDDLRKRLPHGFCVEKRVSVHVCFPMAFLGSVLANDAVDRDGMGVLSVMADIMDPEHQIRDLKDIIGLYRETQADLENHHHVGEYSVGDEVRYVKTRKSTRPCVIVGMDGRGSFTLKDIRHSGVYSGVPASALRPYNLPELPIALSLYKDIQRSNGILTDECAGIGGASIRMLGTGDVVCGVPTRPRAEVLPGDVDGEERVWFRPHEGLLSCLRGIIVEFGRVLGREEPWSSMVDMQVCMDQHAAAFGTRESVVQGMRHLHEYVMTREITKLRGLMVHMLGGGGPIIGKLIDDFLLKFELSRRLESQESTIFFAQAMQHVVGDKKLRQELFRGKANIFQTMSELSDRIIECMASFIMLGSLSKRTVKSIRAYMDSVRKSLQARLVLSKEEMDQALVHLRPIYEKVQKDLSVLSQRQRVPAAARRHIMMGINAFWGDAFVGRDGGGIACVAEGLEAIEALRGAIRQGLGLADVATTTTTIAGGGCAPRSTYVRALQDDLYQEDQVVVDACNGASMWECIRRVVSPVEEEMAGEMWDAESLSLVIGDNDVEDLRGSVSYAVYLLPALAKAVGPVHVHMRSRVYVFSGEGEALHLGMVGIGVDEPLFAVGLGDTENKQIIHIV